MQGFDERVSRVRHTRRMFRRSSFATALWLLAIVLLPVRIANAHLHMCFDGQSPAVTYHAEDVPTHTGTETRDDGHSDRDIDASGATATLHKVNDFDEGASSMISVQLTALALPPLESETPLTAAISPQAPSVFDPHPPARGPPR